MPNITARFLIGLALALPGPVLSNKVLDTFFQFRESKVKAR